MGISIRWWQRLALLALFAAMLPRTSAAQSCGGDCNADGRVVHQRVDSSASTWRSGGDVVTCAAFDTDGSGTVVINELILAVTNALNGCPAALKFVQPTDGTAGAPPGTVAARIALPPGTDGDTVAVQLDGTDVTGALDLSSSEASGNLTDVGAGPHTLTVTAEVNGTPVTR
jgi:hypothetical protein